MENSIAEQYLNGLMKYLSAEDKQQLSYACGATDKQIAALKARFPQCPESLIQLLQKINGTYWQQYGPHTFAVLILGSDVDVYPYYLKSVEQILDENNIDESINDIYGLNEVADETLVGTGINPAIKISN